MAMNSYEELLIWQKSIDLVTDIYKLVKMLPQEESSVLSDQIRRSAVSIPSSIAEGLQQSSEEFFRFLSIAKGSLGKLKTQIIICERLGYFDPEDTDPVKNECDIIDRMLGSLMKNLSAQTKPQTSALNH